MLGFISISQGIVPLGLGICSSPHMFMFITLQRAGMAMLSSSALSHKLCVILLSIYLEPFWFGADGSVPVAPSEVLKVVVSRGHAGHFETAWHNKWKCPISASRHEVYSCYWCHQIKSACKSQSYQSLPCFLAYNSGIAEPSTGASYSYGYETKAFENKINEPWICTKDVHLN